MVRLVFLDDTDGDDVAELAAAHGWDEIGVDTDEFDPVDYPARRWMVPGGQLTFVVDTIFELSYAETDSVAAARVIQDCWGAVDRDGLAARIDLAAPAGQLRRDLRMLARAAQDTEFDETIFGKVSAALQADSGEVRIAAAAVAGRTGWAAFLEPITRLANNERDTTVRGFAGNARTMLELRALARESSR